MSRLVAALAALSYAAPAAAWSPCAARPNALVADLGQHVVNVGYERIVGCYVRVQASAGLYVPWTVDNNVFGLSGRATSGEVSGLDLRVRSFVHPLGGAPHGLWVSPFAQVGVVGSPHGGGAFAGLAYAVGLSVGWTWLLGERVLLGLGLGAQYHVVTFDGGAGFPGFAGLWPTVDINVGWRF